MLFEQGLFEAVDQRLEATIAELHRAMVASHGNQDLLFALAELSFLHGQATTQPAYSLAAAVYAPLLDFSRVAPSRRECHSK